MPRVRESAQLGALLDAQEERSRGCNPHPGGLAPASPRFRSRRRCTVSSARPPVVRRRAPATTRRRRRTARSRARRRGASDASRMGPGRDARPECETAAVATLGRSAASLGDHRAVPRADVRFLRARVRFAVDGAARRRGVREDVQAGAEADGGDGRRRASWGPRTRRCSAGTAFGSSRRTAGALGARSGAPSAARGLGRSA